jgi:cell shape-determining protein MreD
MRRFFAIIESPFTRAFLVGMIVLSFQTTLFNTLRPFSVVMQILLLCSAASGVAAGSESGAIAGFMYDMVLTSPFGLSALVFGFAGYMAGGVNTFAYSPRWWFKMLSVGISSAAAVLIYPAASLVVGVDGLLQTRVLGVALTVGLFNAVLALPAVSLMRWALVKSKKQMLWAE